MNNFESVTLEGIANGNPTLSSLVDNVISLLDDIYKVTKGEDPSDRSWYQFSRDTLPEEYYLTVKTNLAASPALYKAVLTHNYAQNERDYFIKYPLLLAYIQNAVVQHKDQPTKIDIAIFETITEFIDVWPLSPGGYVESTSDWMFRDAHAFLDDASEALPENKDHVDTRLDNDVLTRAISFLNSLVIKLRDNDVGLSEEEETELARSNFAALSTQMRQHLTAEKSPVSDNIALPDGSTAVINTDGKIEVSTPTGETKPFKELVQASKTSDKKTLKDSKTIDKKKVAFVVGGAATLSIIAYFIYKRNKS